MAVRRGCIQLALELMQVATNGTVESASQQLEVANLLMSQPLDSWLDWLQLPKTGKPGDKLILQVCWCMYPARPTSSAVNDKDRNA